MTANIDISTEDDIRLLVSQFYFKVRMDELLSPVFNKVIAEDDWNRHLDVMCDFWGSVLLHNRKYLSDPMSRHLALPISQVHFDRWLLLFESTVDKLFAGEVANEAKKRARTIATLMMHTLKVQLQ